MKENIVEVKGYPFVGHVEQVIKSGKFDLASIFSNPNHSQFYNVSSTGCSFIMGYSYNLKPYLKKYVYKTKYKIDEMYAPNKAAVRKCAYGEVSYIIEVPN